MRNGQLPKSQLANKSQLGKSINQSISVILWIG